MIRACVREGLRTALRQNWVWEPFRRLHNRQAWLYRRLREMREKDVALLERFSQVFADRTVKNGPFAGMRVGDETTPMGFLFWPKLLGSYEWELHEAVEYACRQPYDAVVNVGSAQGYYAIGLARRLPQARVYGYDLDETMHRQLRKMAKLNDVNVELAGLCTPETLLSLDLGARSLIVSDCEGYEEELFAEDVLPALRNHDVIIEVHNGWNLPLPVVLRERFAPTHEVFEYRLLENPHRAIELDFPELKDFTIPERLRMVAENRTVGMRWLVAISRNSPPFEPKVLGNLASRG